MLLQKIKKLNVKKLCPLHGPILKENISSYVEKYDIWSSYKSESEGIFIACCSIHGNTMQVAEKLKGTTCRSMDTSCPDQLAKAITESL